MEKYDAFLQKYEKRWGDIMAGSMEELSKYSFSRAKEELENAKAMFNDGKYKMALNRSYYSIQDAQEQIEGAERFYEFVENIY